MRASGGPSGDYNYRLNCSEYVLHKGDAPVGPLLQEVALAFDAESGTLHKHGAPAMVSKWAEDTSLKLRNVGAADLANALLVISGRFPLPALNKCLTASGYVGVFYAELRAGVHKELPMLP
jgi:hypothetical protein